MVFWVEMNLLVERSQWVMMQGVWPGVCAEMQRRFLAGARLPIGDASMGPGRETGSKSPETQPERDGWIRMQFAADLSGVETKLFLFLGRSPESGERERVRFGDATQERAAAGNKTAAQRSWMVAGQGRAAQRRAGPQVEARQRGL